MKNAQPLVVINVVGLTPDMIGADTPNIAAVAADGFMRPMTPVLPAVTCSVQATLLTGELPSRHGIVANGWYDRSLADVQFWKQSNHLIQAPRYFQTAQEQDPNHRTAKMFWWYNMYADVDCSVTPRPSYPANGLKLPDIYSEPPELRDSLQQELGSFPLFNFWGPTADIRSSRWIADASLRILETRNPDLLLVYLPHLDYNLQRLGPSDPRIREDIRQIDVEAGKLISAAQQRGADILILSEYGISDVSRTIHPNRLLRDAGLLRVRRETLGWESLDCGASDAFAVADHQLAHIYCRSTAAAKRAQQILEQADGVEAVYTQSQLAEIGLDHQRSGDLVAVAGRDAWFTYYFWLDDSVAPDYARTVDIHRKPGYDPAELFVDPDLKFPKLRVIRRLLQKKLGFRYYMDVIGLDAAVVKGSHGRLPEPHHLESDGAVLICSSRAVEQDQIAATDVFGMMNKLQFSDS